MYYLPTESVKKVCGVSTCCAKKQITCFFAQCHICGSQHMSIQQKLNGILVTYSSSLFHSLLIFVMLLKNAPRHLRVVWMVGEQYDRLFVLYKVKKEKKNTDENKKSKLNTMARSTISCIHRTQNHFDYGI